MIIFLDTTSQENYTTAILSENKKTIAEKVFISKNRSEDILENLEKLLSQNHLKKSNIKTIAINIGPKNLNGRPASFTGTRIGATIANSLNLSLGIKIIALENHQKINLNQAYQKIWPKYQKKEFRDLALPMYNHKPNITKKIRNSKSEYRNKS